MKQIKLVNRCEVKSFPLSALRSPLEPARRSRRTGSALLIVLGFLSFLIISAVSFAVLMRVERQAASNFRHASSSRHLLNTALVRAMDEIDSELRITGYADSGRRYPDGSNPPIKFPTNWTGRVRCSAVANGLNNGENADVLSMEALAYIPPALVNDVRRYARPNVDDTDENNNTFDYDVEYDEASGSYGLACNGSENWRGAKWRPIYQPLNYLEAPNNAMGKQQIGRYAYVCVNLSDLPDINRFCASAANWNAISNRVGIGSFFSSESAAATFDERVKNDRGYQSLPDFYAQMSSHSDSVFSDGKQYGSPWLSWMFPKSSGANDSFPDKNFGSASRVPAGHVFVTDGLVKAEPRGETGTIKAFNLYETDNIWMSQPTLTGTIDPGTRNANAFSLSADFWNALVASIDSDDRVSSGNNGLQDIYGAMLADYLDEDSLPRLLSAPSMERTCQINRIFMADGEYLKLDLGWESVNVNPEKGTFQRKWTAKLYSTKNAEQFLNVQVFYPYSDNPSGLQDAVKVYAKISAVLGDPSPLPLYDSLVLDESGLLPPEAKESLMETASGVGGTYRREYGYHVTNHQLDNTPDVTPLENITWTDPTVYQSGAPVTRVPALNVAVYAAAFLYEDSSGNFNERKVVDAAPFAAKDLSSWMEKLKNGGGHVFDFRPAYNGSANGVIQLDPSRFASADSITGESLQWADRNYECPDPRFNHNLNNWVKNNNLGTAGNTTDPSAAGAALAAELVGRDGRDGDGSSVGGDMGEASPLLLSPGELAFLPRPYNNSGSDSNSEGQTPKSSVSDCQNYESFFRTIRLYDQGTSHKRDRLYRYFYCANSDGTVDGARVNPLSDNPTVLATALACVPENYYWARQDAASLSQHLFYKKGSSSSIFSESDWEHVTNAWFKAMQRARAEKLNNHNVGAGDTSTLTILNSLKYNLSDIYGSMGNDLFNWYTAAGGSYNPVSSPKSLFAGSPEEASLGSVLSEAQRKMFFSWTLDNFSDRQQLFLYILAAETVVPSIGNSTDTGAKSLAGGRAVALVWRDPYPAGYTKRYNGNNVTADYTKPADLYEGPEQQDPDCLRRASPWFQYALNNQRGKSTANGFTSRVYDDLSFDRNSRYDNQLERMPNGTDGAYHEQRVLFFRILDD